MPVVSRRTFTQAAAAAAAALSLPATSAAAATSAHDATSTTATVLPQGAPLQSLNVIPIGNLTTPADQVLVACLQGLIAKKSAEQIFIDEGGPGALWKNVLAADHGITLLEERTTWQSLLSHFREHITAYVLYDHAANPASLNVATSLSGPLHALPVDRSLEATVQEIGLTRLALDVTDKDEAWALANYGHVFSKTIAADLNTGISYHLRDYAALTDAYTFYRPIDDERAAILDQLDPGAVLMGYGPDELPMISQASTAGVTSIPSDLAPNLSALSAARVSGPLAQKPLTEPATQQKHYVSFVISDGDNVAWNLWGLQKYLTGPARGSFNVGYGVSPSMADLAPAALDWYYRNALTGPVAEEFIAGPSGTGYTFPSRMTPADLDRYTENLDALMGRAGLGICEILDDQHVIKRDDLWHSYLTRPNIDALLYFGPGAHGQIRRVHGKPVIAQRDVLWGGWIEEDELTERLNSRTPDPFKWHGYSLVLVHCWTKDLAAIRTVVEGLDEHIEVVTPGQLIHLVNRNMAK